MLLAQIQQTPEFVVLGSGIAALNIAYNLLLDLYPDEAKDFMKQIESHGADISSLVINSPQFKQALLTTLESLYRTRDESKRDLIKEIFLTGYLDQSSRESLNLDRLYDVCQRISPEAVLHLRFIKTVILPRKLNEIKARVAQEKINTGGNRENTDEWWVNHYMRLESDSRSIYDWIYENFNPNSEKVKKEFPRIDSDKELMSIQFEKEKEERDRAAELSAELVSLGIFRKSDAVIGGGVTDHITEFGHQLINFLSEIN